MCLLAVAFVASFHLCKLGGTTRYELGETVVASVDGNTSSEASPVVVDACHVCTVVAVPEILIAGNFNRGPVPSSSVTPLVSVLVKSIGPPPKA